MTRSANDKNNEASSMHYAFKGWGNALHGIFACTHIATYSLRKYFEKKLIERDKIKRVTYEMDSKGKIVKNEIINNNNEVICLESMGELNGGELVQHKRKLVTNINKLISILSPVLAGAAVATTSVTGIVLLWDYYDENLKLDEEQKALYVSVEDLLSGTLHAIGALGELVMIFANIAEFRWCSLTGLKGNDTGTWTVKLKAYNRLTDALDLASTVHLNKQNNVSNKATDYLDLAESVDLTIEVPFMNKSSNSASHNSNYSSLTNYSRSTNADTDTHM